MTPLFLYRFFCVVCSPLIFLWVRVRRFRGKEDPVRFKERFGFSSRVRPAGKLIWMHGASVGECLSLLPLIDKVLKSDPKCSVMVTSGTVTSAALMKKRLPERAFHHYIPIDLPWCCRRFVKHWQADGILWVESDFWPNMLVEIQKTRKPLILLNGRISDRSFQRWQKALWFIRPLLSRFSFCLGQTQEDARRLAVLGASETGCVGNLKYAGGVLPFDGAEFDRLKQQMKNRPTFCAGATHHNEEEQLFEMQCSLKKLFPDLLSIIAPRHPNRAHQIEAFAAQKGLTVACRSRQENISDETDVYLADTIGEMGLIYRLSPIVFVGGSLIAFGGQNMLEPMRLGRSVFVGPHAFNFKEMVAKACEAGALTQVKSFEELGRCFEAALAHPEKETEKTQKAVAFATREADVLDRLYSLLTEKGGI